MSSCSPCPSYIVTSEMTPVTPMRQILQRSLCSSVFGGRKIDIIKSLYGISAFNSIQINQHLLSTYEGWGTVTPSRGIWILRGKKRALLNSNWSISNGLPSPRREIFVFWNLSKPYHPTKCFLFLTYRFDKSWKRKTKQNKKKPGRCWYVKNEEPSSKHNQFFDQPSWNYFYKYLMRFCMIKEIICKNWGHTEMCKEEIKVTNQKTTISIQLFFLVYIYIYILVFGKSDIMYWRVF